MITLPKPTRPAPEMPNVKPSANNHFGGCWGASCDTSNSTVTLRFDDFEQALRFYTMVQMGETT